MFYVRDITACNIVFSKTDYVHQSSVWGFPVIICYSAVLHSPPLNHGDDVGLNVLRSRADILGTTVNHTH